MRGKSVKEEYGGEGGLRGDHSTGDGGLIFGGSLGLARRRVEFCSQEGSVQAPGCWRFWAQGPGYPYDILELGSYLVGRVELGFGQCFAAAVKEASDRQTKDY